MISKYFIFLLALAPTGALSYVVPTVKDVTGTTRTVLEFLYPKKGIQFIAGQNHYVVWNSTVNKVKSNLYLAQMSTGEFPFVYLLASNVTLTAGRDRMKVEIPKGVPAGECVLYFNTTSFEDHSDPFMVVQDPIELSMYSFLY